MRFLLGLIFVFVLAVPASLSPALAQKLPTVKEVGNIVFKEVEKRAIEEFFSKKAADAAPGGKDKKAKKWKKGKARVKVKVKVGAGAAGCRRAFKCSLKETAPCRRAWLSANCRRGSGKSWEPRPLVPRAPLPATTASNCSRSR